MADLDGEEGEEAYGDDSAAAGFFGRFAISRKKLILIAAPLLLVLVLAAVAGVYFSGIADPWLHKTGKSAESAEEAPPKPGQGPAFLDIPEIMVNLNSDARQQHYLKIEISLELANPLDRPKVNAMLPVLVNDFQVYLREYRPQDLSGSGIMVRLRDDLLVRINDRLRPAKVNDVLFKGILVQ